MKNSDKPSIKAHKYSYDARERIRDVYHLQKEYLEPGRIQHEIFKAFLAGYKHAKALERKTKALGGIQR